MKTRIWTAEGEMNTVTATTEAAARRKLESMTGHAVVGRVYVSEEAEAYDELPDCACGWRGRGSGPSGQFMLGDRCPACGEGLD